MEISQEAKNKATILRNRLGEDYWFFLESAVDDLEDSIIDYSDGDETFDELQKKVATVLLALEAAGFSPQYIYQMADRLADKWLKALDDYKGGGGNDAEH